MSGCHFWFAVSHHCLPEAQSSGKWLVNRGLEEGLTWPHTLDLSSTSSGTTANSCIEMKKKKITKHFIDRYFICQPSLESLLSPPAQAPVPGVNKTGKQENTHVPSSQQLCATQRDSPCTSTQHSSPALSTALPGSSYPHSIPTNPTTTVPQGWTLTCASSRFMEQAGWASLLFGFPGHS